MHVHPEWEREWKKGELEHEAAWDFRDDHDDVHAPHVHVLLCPQLDGHSFPLMMAGSHPGGPGAGRCQQDDAPLFFLVALHVAEQELCHIGS